MRAKDKIEEGVYEGVGLLVVAGIVVAGMYLAQKYLGLSSYLGMNEAQIKDLAQEMDSRCRILTRACTKDGCRGIYLGGACSGIPIYYHYKRNSYYIYPLLWPEMWGTSRDILGLTGQTTVHRSENTSVPTSYS